MKCQYCISMSKLHEQQAEQIEGLEKIIEVRDMQVNELQAENARLKELCDKQKEYYERIDDIGYDAICADLMDEITKIEAAQPQKGQDNE